MQKKNFDTKKAQDKGLEFLYIKVHKDNILAESKDSILLSLDEMDFEQLDKDDSIWIQKKFVFPSEYTNKVSITIVKDWKYQCVDCGLELSGQQIHKALKNYYEG